MVKQTYRIILLAVATCGLAACGGGGGGGGSGVASTPTPTPTPASAAIIPAATTSQQFAAKGATFDKELLFQAIVPGNYGPPEIGDGPIQLRYNATTRLYEADFAGDDQGWLPLQNSGGPTEIWLTGNGQGLSPQISGAQYSALLGVIGLNILGASAVGIPTPQAGVPVTGSASYSGAIYGRSTQLISDPFDGTSLAEITGSITLAFNFGSGSLSGSMSPLVFGSSLGTLNFKNTVYSTGSTTFSGAFDANLSGPNSFSGLFTGPSAQELIGNFAFPYGDGTQTYQAAGAFIARRP